MNRSEIVVRKVTKNIREYFISPDLDTKFTELPFFELHLPLTDSTRKQLELLTDEGQMFFDSLESNDKDINVDSIIFRTYSVEIHRDGTEKWSQLENRVIGMAFVGMIQDSEFTYTHSTTTAPIPAMTAHPRR